MKRITFKEFKKNVEHMKNYEITLEKQTEDIWEARVTTSDNYLTTIFLEHIVDNNLNITVKNDKIIIDNI